MTTVGLIPRGQESGVVRKEILVGMVNGLVVGSVVPLVLQRWGVDPAVASSMFVTPVTDAVGFLLLLGLASWLLL